MYKRQVKNEIESLPIKVSKKVIYEWILNCFSFFVLILERSQLSFLGIVKGVNSFISLLWLHLWSTPLMGCLGIGEHHLNCRKKGTY